MTLQCGAAGCIRPATDTGTRNGVLLWAACDEHAAAMVPRVDHRGRTLTVAGRMLLETARAAVAYRMALRRFSVADPEAAETIAEEVLEALCGTPPMRAMLLTYLTEIEERDGAA